MDVITHRFSLEKGSKKHPCPGCGKRRFNRYVDNETGEYIDNDVGMCDRLESCGYHLPPREYFESNGFTPKERVTTIRRRPSRKPGRIPYQYIDERLNRYDVNQLTLWMSKLPGWDSELSECAAKLYRLGTGGGGSDVDGWPIFWQIDNNQEVRSGKMIRYNHESGKRIKSEGFNYTWVHSRMIKAGLLPDDETKWSLEQCLFGLHLITDDEKRTIAIVEGEKTALIASQYYPKFVWLSCGQLNGLSTSKLKPLRGRKVVLFPDKGTAFQIWKNRAAELKSMITFIVSDLLETHAPDEHNGYDIADYLTQFDIRAFKGSTRYAPHGFNQWTGEVFDKRGYPSEWDNISAEIEPPEAIETAQTV